MEIERIRLHEPEMDQRWLVVRVEGHGEEGGKEGGKVEKRKRGVLLELRE